MTKPVVLVLCTGNSCRSHLAEGILRRVAGDIFTVHSAGSKPAGYVHPRAIEAMREIDIDISGHTSKHLSEFFSQRIDTVITVCGHADSACPTIPLRPGEAMKKWRRCFAGSGIRSSWSLKPTPPVIGKG